MPFWIVACLVSIWCIVYLDVLDQLRAPSTIRNWWLRGGFSPQLKVGYLTKTRNWVILDDKLEKSGTRNDYVKTGKKYETVTEISNDKNICKGLRFCTDKNTRHNYTLTYDWLLPVYRDYVKNEIAKGVTNIEPIKLMEVGVHGGASMRLWREYFPEETLIFGADINTKVPYFPL